ncbi:MAG: insulinase family protein [Desulfuromonadales bacterium]|nr:insulinase family protein [Desulfuromonadales bacterium]
MPHIPAEGTLLHGFRIIDSTPLAELNATLVRAEHQRTGARLAHLACADPNNVFAVTFRTPPADSSGVAHILEHTVLCGSQRYPVRDPFFAMLKRSLNTFMNAMTASDWTCYPVASMNRKDFYNLMGIYLDAVFFPLLREQDFHQEGHRLEFADPLDPSSPLQIKGVVFNEMKGAMADPSSLLGRRLNRELFPTTCYGHNSGGEPLEIPALSWEQLRAFHAGYYHPGNSWFFTYGDLPMAGHLEQIDALALRRFERQETASAVPAEVRFATPKRAEETFPISPQDDPGGRSMVQLAWLVCPIEDTFERAASGILAGLLLGDPAAPLYQALLDSRLGQNLTPGTGYHDDYRDTVFAVGLQGTDPEQTDAVERLVLETLERIAREGFPAERVEAALHQYEFSSREVSGDQYPYGLSLLMRFLGPWLHADDPLPPLQLERNLAALRHAATDPAFFPALIRRRLLDNPHRVTLLLRPDQEHARREEEALAQCLERAATALDDAERARLVAAAAELQCSQEAHDDTSCLPTLELADIDPAEQQVAFVETRIAGIKTLWFAQPTNGITYLSLQFDTNGLPEDLRRWLPLFCALLPQIGAAGQDYLTIAKRITAVTGGIRLGTNLLEDPTDLGGVRAVIDLRAKALDPLQGAMTELLTELLTAPDFNDHERLRTVIGQVRITLENSIPGSGHSYAARAAAATLTPAARRREEWAGMSQVRLIQQAAALDDIGLAELAGQFSTIAAQLLTADRVAAAVTAEAAAHSGMTPRLAALLAALPTGTGTTAEPSASEPALSATIAWSVNAPLAYVARVFRTVPYCHQDAAPLLVLAKLLRANYLHREIREKGGAYGGMAGYNADGGLLSLLSYRDPHLLRTLGVYRDAVEWACLGEFTDEMIREAILATFGELDRPLSPGGRGHREFLCQQQGLSVELRQGLRDGILAVGRETLAAAAQRYLRDDYETSAVGVLAGDGLLEAAREELEKMGTKFERL